jgi:hypothetical protein
MKESTLDRMTKGKWHYSSGMVWAGSQKDFSKLEETGIVKADRDEEKTTPTERDANARACAEVPAMLEALKAIVLRFDYLESEEKGGIISFRKMGSNGEIAKARQILADLDKKD